MIERGEHVCLAHKASAALSIESQVGGQHFQRHVPAKTRIVSAIDLPIPPSPSFPRTSYGPILVPDHEALAGWASAGPPAPSEPTTSNGPILLPGERLTATLSERRDILRLGDVAKQFCSDAGASRVEAVRATTFCPHTPPGTGPDRVRSTDRVGGAAT